MPDAGDFSRERTNQAMPASWASAFTSLPDETPTPDGWQRLQARLPELSAPQRTRWPLWLATAASLALIIAIPMWMQATTNTALTGSAMATPATSVLPTQATREVGAEVALTAIEPVSNEDTSTARMTLPTLAASVRVRKPRRSRHVDPSQRPIRTAAQPADTTRIANAETPDAPASDANLESLYLQSAQLEGLLVLARDDSVSTGTAAALTDALSGQIIDIDAALIQQDTSMLELSTLWRDRVETLRQLVGIETTQRLYSARGQQYEAALVSID